MDILVASATPMQMLCAAEESFALIGRIKTLISHEIGVIIFLVIGCPVLMRLVSQMVVSLETFSD